MISERAHKARMPTYAKDHPHTPSADLLVKLNTALMLFEHNKHSAAMMIVATNQVRQWQGAMTRLDAKQEKNQGRRVPSKHS